MQRGIRERLARIETEARTLARSGEFGSSRSVELALVAKGYTEAHKIFANRWTRSEIDRLCELAAYRTRANEPQAA
jgi:hypothetical protein